jgi:hypothetical protein
MSRAPSQRRPTDKASVGSRSFKRSKALRERASRRDIARRRALLSQKGLILSVRTLVKRVPHAAWVCALVAFLNGAAWSIITPPFEGRDEPAHFAYVEQLAETGTLPKETSEESSPYSQEETAVLEGLHQPTIKLIPQIPAISTRAEQQALSEDLNAGLSREGNGEAGVATSEPPAYYALQTVPYMLGGSNMLTQLELMRLFDGLMAALTAILSFFFIAEVLPSVPWAATVGALCVAVQPLFGFMSGTLNPDSMVYLVTAALLLCLARAFHRGLTRKGALVLGGLTAIGFLTKLTFIGFAFGLFISLALLGVREVRRRSISALLDVGIAMGIGLAPILLYVLLNAVSGNPALGGAAGLLNALATTNVFHAISYAWQLYLPHLPGMPHFFHGMFTFRDIWFDRLVGLYGWLDTQFPTWVDNVALGVAGGMALLCLRELFAGRRAIRDRLPELACYIAVTVGVLLMVGLTSYSADALAHIEAYTDPRYLLPLLPLLGVGVALAVRGGGRRWAPVVGALVVVVFLAHDLFSQLQTVARYYG